MCIYIPVTTGYTRVLGAFGVMGKTFALLQSSDAKPLYPQLLALVANLVQCRSGAVALRSTQLGGETPVTAIGKLVALLTGPDPILHIPAILAVRSLQF